jgi:hypothetical protein
MQIAINRVLGMAEIQRADKQSLKLAILALVMLLLKGCCALGSV